MAELQVTKTDLEGMFLVNLVTHSDERGSFREAFQAAKLEALGLPRLGSVQWNISENTREGILRGIHVEPWDKYIHVIQGQVFAAMVDLRKDSVTFKQHRTFELDPSNALYVPKGIGNSYQVLSASAIYGYLVNAHFDPRHKYLGIAYNDPELEIQWPLAPKPEDVSEKDKHLPTMEEALK